MNRVTEFSNDKRSHLLYTDIGKLATDKQEADFQGV
jgi:hypothetical protein